jgi:exosome complex RNA-binding protein Rrp4
MTFLKGQWKLVGEHLACRYIPSEGDAIIGYIIERHAEVSQLHGLMKIKKL